MSDGIQYIDLDTSDPNVIALRLVDHLTGSAMHEFIERIEKIRQRGEKACVYIDISGYSGLEASAATEKLAGFRTLWSGIERLAYVVDKAWMTKASGLIDAITPMHFRAFSQQDDAQARAWVLRGD